jgi:hypothetical protein
MRLIQLLRPSAFPAFLCPEGVEQQLGMNTFRSVDRGYQLSYISWQARRYMRHQPNNASQVFQLRAAQYFGVVSSWQTLVRAGGENETAGHDD